MIFKVNSVVLDQIKATVDQHGICYVHGTGQFYVDKKRSDDHKEYSDPDIKEADYRLVFKKGDRIPDTVEEIEKMFFAAKQQETIDSRKTPEAKNTTIVNMPKVEKEKPLESLSKAELIEKAKNLNISIEETDSKKTILAKLKE